MGNELKPIYEEQPQYPARELGTPRAPEDEDCPEGTCISYSNAERMQAAGFSHEPVIAPDGSEVLTTVLVNIDGDILAVWDEGRWWSAYESARYMQEYTRAYTALRAGQLASLPRHMRRRMK